MRSIPAGQFKAKCLAIMDEVQARSEPIVITKRGKPVVRLMPVEDTSAESRSIFGFMRGKVVIADDIVGPIISEEEWEHLKEESKSSSTL